MPDDDRSIPMKASEATEMMNSLALVAKSIAPYEKPMYLGVSKPSECVNAIIGILEQKLKG